MPATCGRQHGQRINFSPPPPPPADNVGGRVRDNESDEGPPGSIAAVCDELGIGIDVLGRGEETQQCPCSRVVQLHCCLPITAVPAVKLFAIVRLPPCFKFLII